MKPAAGIVLLLVAFAAGPARAEAAPSAVVESLHAVLLACMQEGPALGHAERAARVAARLDETFDLPFMARMSVAAVWQDLTPAQRDAFVRLSRRLSAASYANNFSSHDGQRFETLGEEPAARGTRLVKTRFVQPRDEDVLFDYRLRKTPSGWRIIDVQLGGQVSELALRRSDYRATIEREGFEKLVEELEAKIATLEGE